MPHPQRLGPISPFFIVESVPRATAFYVKRLGFTLQLSTPNEEPFFAIVGRDGVRILLKEVAPDVKPQPNHTRHAWAPWDAYVFAPDPDALATEWESGGLRLHQALKNREDGLRGFEVRDVNGYVLFFGRPLDRESSACP